THSRLEHLISFYLSLYHGDLHSFPTRRSSDLPESDLLTQGAKCPCGGSEFTKEADILDVWFESGCSYLVETANAGDQLWPSDLRSEEHTSELQSLAYLVCRLLLEKKNQTLHRICNDIVHEYRFPTYHDVRLLDEVEQHLFAYRYAEIANYDEFGFWTHFQHYVQAW